MWSAPAACRRFEKHRITETPNTICIHGGDRSLQDPGFIPNQEAGSAETKQTVR